MNNEEQETKKIDDPLKLLLEIEAFLCLRSLADEPSIEEDDMKTLLASVRHCLSVNGIEF